MMPDGGNHINAKLPSPSVKGTASQRINLAVDFLSSAFIFSEKCRELEDSHRGEPFGNFFDDIICYASSAVIMSVTALEANINEIRDDLKITTDLCGSITNKYQLLLEIKNKEPFNKSCEPFQSVDSLIKLRNALVHFEPEWDNKRKKHKELDKKLQGKFELSPFIDENSFSEEIAPFIFPTRCMSHGCASWAVETSKRFMNDFGEKLGRPEKFAPFTK